MWSVFPSSPAGPRPEAATTEVWRALVTRGSLALCRSQRRARASNGKVDVDQSTDARLATRVTYPKRGYTGGVHLDNETAGVNHKRLKYWKNMTNGVYSLAPF